MSEEEDKNRIYIRAMPEERKIITDHCKSIGVAVSKYMVQTALEDIRRRNGIKTDTDLILIEKRLTSLNNKVAKERAEAESFQEDVRNELKEIKSILIKLTRKEETP
jgi:uncharacterized protein (DUF1778 family)